ncbi:hypothetical protein Tco_0808597 [Tanacetum coccineum]
MGIGTYNGDCMLVPRWKFVLSENVWRFPAKKRSIIDASICPIFISWHTSVSVVKDPLPSDNRVNIELLNLLDHHRTVIRRYPETLLCLVGLSRSFDDLHVRPTLLRDDESDMGLLDYVKSVDPFKIMEHTIVDELREHAGKKKRKVAFDTLPPKKLRADRVATSEPVTTTSGKSPAALRRLELQSEPQGVGSSFAPHPIEEFASSSVTPTLEPDIPEDYGSTQDAAVQTHRASMRIVVTSTFALDTDSPIDDFFDSQTVDTVTAENVYVSEWSAALHNQSNADFLDSFNVNFAQHHDVEIAALKIKLEKSKSEATEVVVLRSRVSELEAGAVARSEEVDTLNKQNDELLGKVSALESGRGELNKHIIRLGADCERLLNEVANVSRDMDDDLYPHIFTAIAGRRWVLGHGLRLAVMKCTQSAKCRSVLGRAISLAIDNGIQEGMEARIEHGKSGRSLAQVKAYNPEVKDRYVAAVTDFKNVSFTLLDELESLKDSPLASIISALVLKDDQGNMPLSEVIPAVCVATERKGLCPPSGSTTGVVAVSAPLQDSSLGVGDYQVSTFTLTDDGVAHPLPVTVQPPKDDLFDSAIFDKPADA